MKKIIFLFCILAAVATCRVIAQVGLTDAQKNVPANQWGSVAGSMQVSIGLNTTANEVEINQDAQFIVRIKNLSTNQEIAFYAPNSILTTPGLSFTIISPSGKDLSPAPYKNKEATRLSGLVFWIHPTQVDGFIVNLSQICKMDELGTYKITLKTEHNLYDVISNPLYVKVVPATGSPH